MRTQRALVSTVWLIFQRTSPREGGAKLSDALGKSCLRGIVRGRVRLHCR